MSGTGGAGHVGARIGRLGPDWRGSAKRGEAWHGLAGTARLVLVAHGSVRQAGTGIVRLGSVGTGKVRPGAAGMAGRIKARSGKFWQAGQAWLGGLGLARTGELL